MDAAHLTMTQAAKLRPSPTVPGSMEAAVKMWLQVGNIQKLQQAVLDGYGWLLQDNNSRLPHVNKFLKRVPEYQEKIDTIHEQVIRGELRAVRRMIGDKKGWGNARDHYGHSPMHKSVMANQEDVMRWLIDSFPDLVEERDNEGRTPLHYAAALQGTTSGSNRLYNVLVESASANENVVDVQGHSPSFYKDHPQDIRHRTVQSRRPPPVTTHLIKGDPDSATSPSKYDDDGAKPQNLPDVVKAGPKRGGVRKKKEEVDISDELELAIRDMDESESSKLPSNYSSKVNFRTLSSSSSDGEDQINNKANVKAAKKKYKKTPVPQRKTVVGKKKEVEKPEANANNAAANEEFEDLAALKGGISFPAGEIDTGSVSKHDIEKFLHKSKMQMDVKDIRRAMKNAQKIGEKDTVSKEPTRELLTRKKDTPFGRKLIKSKPSNTGLNSQGAESLSDERQRIPPLKKTDSLKSQLNDFSERKQSKGDESLEEQKRLDLIKASRGARKTMAKFELEHKTTSGGGHEGSDPKAAKATLALVTKANNAASPSSPTKKKFAGANHNNFKTGDYADADQEFYKDFRVIYVVLPVTNNDLPLPPPNRAYLRTLIHNSDLEHLEKVVLDGHGYRLLHESSAIGKVTKFLSTLPDFMDIIAILHNAVTAGVVPVVNELLTSERLALSRDPYGATPLHKAVLFYQPKIVKLIAEKYRITTRAKDQEGRTPLHYAAALHDSGIFYRYLLKCGADEHIQDKYGKTSKFYVYAPGDIDLNSLVGRCKEMPRKREHQEIKKFSILPSQQVQHETFVHTTPPRTLSTNQIRDWIRHADLTNLDQAVLDGHGHKLVQESASDGKIRAFLRSVPSYMKKIELLHECVVKNELRELQNHLTRRKMAASKDDNGHGLLHKAVFYGHKDIVHWLVDKFPETAEVKDWVRRDCASFSGSF